MTSKHKDWKINFLGKYNYNNWRGSKWKSMMSQ